METNHHGQAAPNENCKHCREQRLASPRTQMWAQFPVPSLNQAGFHYPKCWIIKGKDLGSCRWRRAGTFIVLFPLQEGNYLARWMSAMQAEDEGKVMRAFKEEGGSEAHAQWCRLEKCSGKGLLISDISKWNLMYVGHSVSGWWRLVSQCGGACWLVWMRRRVLLHYFVFPL